MSPKVLAKIKKYYDEHPYYETYRGWIIRKHEYEAKYLGTLVSYTCDVYVGGESCSATHVHLVKEWIDKKIEEGKVQKEDYYLIENYEQKEH